MLKFRFQEGNCIPLSVKQQAEIELTFVLVAVIAEIHI